MSCFPFFPDDKILNMIEKTGPKSLNSFVVLQKLEEWTLYSDSARGNFNKLANALKTYATPKAGVRRPPDMMTQYLGKTGIREMNSDVYSIVKTVFREYNQKESDTSRRLGQRYTPRSGSLPPGSVELREILKSDNTQVQTGRSHRCPRLRCLKAGSESCSYTLVKR